ncbi:MAG: hypothetical protein ACP5NQ_06770 [Vulcanisaeta sp.]
MNLIRIGTILLALGLLLLFITSSILPKIYNTIISMNKLGIISVNLGNYSSLLIPIYISNPAYIIVVLNISHPLSIYVLDEFGHVFTPLSYDYKHGLYLVTFSLMKNGNYSLILLNNYPGIVNASLSITVIYRYLLNNALFINVLMDLEAAISVIGALLIIMKYLGRIKLMEQKLKR